MGTELKPLIEEKGLSTFQLEEVIVDTTAPSDAVIPSFVVNDPYPDQTPADILSRWYQSSATQTLTDTTSLRVAQIADPSVILAQPAVLGALVSYRYFRFKAIEYKVQFSSTPMIYGWAFLSTKGVNFVTLPTSTPIAGYQLASQDDAVLMDFSEQQEINLMAEWRSPAQMYDLVGGSATGLSNIHSLWMYSGPNPVHKFNSAAPAVVTIQVFARFVEPRVMGHVYRSLSAMVDMSERFERAESQMDFSNINMGAVAAGVLGMGASMAGNTAWKYAEKTATTCAEETLNSLLSNDVKEEEPPAETDADLRPSVYGSMYRSRARYLLGTGALGSSEKKNSVKEYIMMPTFFTVFTLTNGTNTFTSLAYSPYTWSRINFVAQCFRMYRGSLRYTLIFIGSPFITARYFILLDWLGDSTTLPTYRIGDQQIIDVTMRGTTRVDFSVPYMNPIPWAPTPTQSITLGPPDGQNLPNIKIITIQPPSGIGDITPEVDVIVYSAAGPDFEFRSQVTPGFERTTVERAQSQMKVATFCLVDGFGTSGSNLCGQGSKENVTFEGLGSRWQPFEDETEPQYDVASYTINTRNLFSGIFRFYKGGCQRKIAIVSDPTHPDVGLKLETHGISDSGTLGWYDNDRIEDGINIINTVITRVIECTEPFVNTFEFLPTSNDFAWNVGDFLLNSDDTFWQSEFVVVGNPLVAPDVQSAFIANAPDFRYMMSMPPPRYAYWPINDRTLNRLNHM